MATFERIFFSVMDKLQAFGLVASGLGILAVLGFLVILGVLAFLATLGLPVPRWGAAIFSPFSPFHLFTLSPFRPHFHIFLPIKHKKVGLKFGGIPKKEYLCTR